MCTSKRIYNLNYFKQINSLFQIFICTLSFDNIRFQQMFSFNLTFFLSILYDPETFSLERVKKASKKKTIYTCIYKPDATGSIEFSDQCRIMIFAIILRFCVVYKSSKFAIAHVPQ